MSNAQWAMKAKASGYPLCPRCFEPVPKSDWKAFDKRGMCLFCARLIDRTDWQDKLDQALQHAGRHDQFVFYELP